MERDLQRELNWVGLAIRNTFFKKVLHVLGNPNLIFIYFRA